VKWFVETERIQRCAANIGSSGLQTCRCFWRDLDSLATTTLLRGTHRSWSLLRTTFCWRSIWSTRLRFSNLTPSRIAAKKKRKEKENVKNVVHSPYEIRNIFADNTHF